MMRPLPIPAGSFEFFVTTRGAVWRTLKYGGDQQRWLPIRTSNLAQLVRDAVRDTQRPTTYTKLNGGVGISAMHVEQYLTMLEQDIEQAWLVLDRLNREWSR